MASEPAADAFADSRPGRGSFAALGRVARLAVLISVVGNPRADAQPPLNALQPPLKMAAIVTSYFHNSHADLIVGRLLETNTLDGRGDAPNLRLASLYTDQVPENDKSRELARKHGFAIHDTIAGALTLGGDKLAVDGVLIVAEHGAYPESESGQFVYPKRRFLAESLAVMDRGKSFAPIFNDKQLSDTWTDAKWMVDQVHERKIPMLAGSSLPTTWRRPEADIRRDAVVREIAAVSYHRLDSYGFHALEMVQALAEQRRGGETGIAQVRCLIDAAVWQAGRDGLMIARCLTRPCRAWKSRCRRERKLKNSSPIPSCFLSTTWMASRCGSSRSTMRSASGRPLGDTPRGISNRPFSGRRKIGHSGISRGRLPALNR